MHWTRVQAEKINNGSPGSRSCHVLDPRASSNRVHSLVCESFNFVFSSPALYFHSVLCTGVNNSLQAPVYSCVISFSSSTAHSTQGLYFCTHNTMLIHLHTVLALFFGGRFVCVCLFLFVYCCIVYYVRIS